MTRLADIRSAHWQPRLGADGVVEGVADVHQAIRIILMTPKGADLLRPDFGSDVHRYLDQPIDRARPHVVRECVEAIRIWEKRVQVVRVVVEVADVAALRVRVIWKMADGVQQDATEVLL